MANQEFKKIQEAISLYETKLTENVKKAIPVLEKYSNYAIANSYLYSYYLLDEHDYKKADYYLRKGAALGDSSCCFYTMNMSYNRGDYDKALSIAIYLARRIPEFGTDSIISDCYENGYAHLAVDIDKAEFYMDKAAKNCPDKHAATYVAFKLRNDKIFVSEGIKQLESFAAGNDENAKNAAYYLWLYYSGKLRGVNSSYLPEKKLQYLNRALELDEYNKDAKRELAEFYDPRNESNNEKDANKAMDLYYSLYSPLGYLRIALMIEKGVLTKYTWYGIEHVINEDDSESKYRAVLEVLDSNTEYESEVEYNTYINDLKAGIHYYGLNGKKDKELGASLARRCLEHPEYCSYSFEILINSSLADTSGDVEPSFVFNVLSSAINNDYAPDVCKDVINVAIARCHHLGFGTKQNSQLATELYEKHIDKASGRNTSTIGWYGDYFSDGICCEPDFERAFEVYKVGAEEKNYYCVYKMGEMYENGLGTEINLDEAVACYKEAHANKEIHATLALIRLGLLDKDACIDEPSVSKLNAYVLMSTDKKYSDMYNLQTKPYFATEKTINSIEQFFENAENCENRLVSEANDIEQAIIDVNRENLYKKEKRINRPFSFGCFLNVVINSFLILIMGLSIASKWRLPISASAHDFASAIIFYGGFALFTLVPIMLFITFIAIFRSKKVRRKIYLVALLILLIVALVEIQAIGLEALYNIILHSFTNFLNSIGLGSLLQLGQ